MLLKHLTLSAAAVYLAGVLVGFFMDPHTYAWDPDVDVSLCFLEQPKRELFWAIAGNNISVALINLMGGFSLGIVSLLNTFYNGVVLGFALSVSMADFPVMDLLKHLLPHAIEILGIILSCTLGLYIGTYLIRKLVLDSQPQFAYRMFMLRTALVMTIIVAAAFLEVHFSFS